MNFKDMQKMVHELAKEKGWHPDGPVDVPEKLCLVHSEVSEALECYRSPLTDAATMYYGACDKPEGIPAELADVVIRVMDLAEALGIDLEAAIIEKHLFNATRPHRHGGKRA